MTCRPGSGQPHTMPLATTVRVKDDLILALDCATDGCAVALVRGPRALAMESIDAERGQAELLLPMVQRVRDAAQIALADIARVAVTTGPGSFTGIRIGLSAARGLALTLGVPVVGIDCFAAIAHGVPDELRARGLTVAIESKREALFAQSFDAALNPVGDAVALPPDELAARLAQRTVVGTGAARLAAADPGLVLLPDYRRPDPVALARLGAAADPRTSPARPLYLRPPDAAPPRAKLKLEALGPAWFDLAAALHATSFTPPWDVASLAASLADPTAFGWIAIEGAQPVGLILARAPADQAEILTIAVRPEARRRGIARQLMAAAVDEANRRRAESMFLEVADGNEAARALYQSLGFTEESIRRRYYADGQDARILKRKLAET
ncbi:MAG: tsaB [Rhodospirillales bacterium]|jgi:tRNA threonylcarbamoyladenosine biosynthesis protein TsaB|nr:tsaB [Rhodospirillales bacterium]